MTPAAQRPEDRSRSRNESTPWIDTLPACFRSEAFAEDLHGDAEPAAPRPAGSGLRPLGLWLAAAVAVLPALADR